MARLIPPDPERPDLVELTARIVAQRGHLHPPYDLLLHSPPFAAGWLDLLSAVRHHSTLPGGLRELVIMRVAALTRAPYEAAHHAPIARREGVTQEQLDAITHWRDAECFAASERDVLAYVDELTVSVQVSETTLRAVRRHFDDRALVELTVTIGAYGMVSRFLEAFGVSAPE